LFQRVIEHGRRRSEEVREVAETVREIGLTPWSAQARPNARPGLPTSPIKAYSARRETQAFARSRTGAPKPTVSRQRQGRPPVSPDN